MIGACVVGDFVLLLFVVRLLLTASAAGEIEGGDDGLSTVVITFKSLSNI
jgi:hypothetical protein